jgi:serine/threonine protein kinase
MERYRLLKELGRGGMGKVYLGAHKLTGRVAAVKVILPQVEVKKSAFLRFQREISIMRHLQHPHLVRLYETSRENDKTHFISEFVQGGDLCQYISRRGKPLLEPERAVRIIAQALVGLDYFHTQADKYVHRDLKPENILIRQDNGRFTAKLADFGLARSYEKHGGTVTKAGEFAGTWFYMPPEQIQNFKECKPPTDIYSMGVTLYYLLTGALPLDLPAPWKVKAGKHFQVKAPIPVVVVHGDRISLGKRRSDLPRKLIRTVDKAIHKEAGRRYQTAEAFRADLLAAVD